MLLPLWMQTETSTIEAEEPGSPAGQPRHTPLLPVPFPTKPLSKTSFKASSLLSRSLKTPGEDPSLKATFPGQWICCYTMVVSPWYPNVLRDTTCTEEQVTSLRWPVLP